METHILDDGRLAAFALNLHSSPQTTTLLAPDGATFAPDVRAVLPAQEVERLVHLT